MRLRLLLSLLLFLVGCDTGVVPCPEPPAMTAVVLRTDGTLVRHFPIAWNNTDFGPHPGSLTLGVAGGRYLVIHSHVDPPKIYDLQTGSLIRQGNPGQALTPDPAAPRFLASHSEEGDFTFPGGATLNGDHALRTFLREESPTGVTRTLVADSARQTAPNRVRFTAIGSVFPVAEGDVLYLSNDVEWQAHTDSLGRETYFSQYDFGWRLSRYDAATGTSSTLLPVRHQPYYARVDPEGRTFTYYASSTSTWYVVDLASGTATPITDWLRNATLAPDGRTLLLERADAGFEVYDVATGRRTPLPLASDATGHYTPGPDDFVYLVNERNTSLGVWRLPLSPPGVAGRLSPVWVGEPALRLLEARGESVPSSAPVFADERTLVVLFNAAMSYEVTTCR